MRTGLTLLGVYLLVNALGSLAHLPRGLASIDQMSMNLVVVENWFLAFAVSTTSIGVLQMLPAILLIKYSSRIAERLGGPNVSGAISEGSLYTVLATVLAIYCLVTGAGQFLAGSVSLWPSLFGSSGRASGEMLPYVVGPVLEGSIRLAASVILYNHILGFVARGYDST